MKLIWIGDLNYRIVGLNAEEVLDRLKDPQTMHRCFAENDSLRRDQAAGLAFYGFKEPSMAKDFFPTYKKFRNRPDLQECTSPHSLSILQKV